MTTEELFDAAFEQHQAGNLPVAEALYRRVVAAEPRHGDSLHLLGVLCHQRGNNELAERFIRAAIDIKPTAGYLANLGLTLAAEGKLEEAIGAYRKAVDLRHNLPDVHNNLANALRQTGKPLEAIDSYRQAIAHKPDFFDAHNNLGLALIDCGRIDDAIESFRLAASINAKQPEAWNNLGVMLSSRGKLAEAIEAYEQAISLCAIHADSHYNLAIALHAQGQREQAIISIRRVIELSPNNAPAHNNLGIWLCEDGRHADALAALDNAIRADARYAQAHGNRGNILKQMGRLAEAVASYRQAIDLKPDAAEPHNNLGNALKQMERLEEAAAAFEQAITLQPDLSQTHNNLGNVRKDQARLDDAIACYDRAMDLKPDDAAADSNRIYTLHFHPGYSAHMILAEHKKWNEHHADALKMKIAPHKNEVSPGRRLRIGYVAPDFRDHCQSLFTIPFLSNHDHQQFEIFCYSDVARPDAVTARLRGYADTWRNIVGMDDQAVAQLVRQDQIDILVDLTVHMAYNRLLVFAQKPAPVQVTWLGYPSTTGLDTMDYRIGDPHLDPSGTDNCYSEQTLRLPGSFWCYDPLTQGPAVNELPAEKNGFITFGCLNNFCKINDLTLALWAKVLESVEDSRLMLLAPAGESRQRVLKSMSALGIAQSRIQFAGRQSRQNYLHLYHAIDIGLDTFPYNGHTTSLDAFWMGVPVISKIGDTAVGRGGYSQLRNLGLLDLCGDTDAQFVKIAVSLAGNRPWLRELRSSLRGRLQRSVMMNAGQFARNMESAYRQMWERYCAEHSAKPQIAPHIADALRIRQAPRFRQAS